MGVKHLLVIVILIVFISACYTPEKTIPVVTDVGEVSKEEAVDVGEEKELEKNETILEEDREEPEELEEAEINKSEEQKEELPPGTHVIIIKDLKLEPQELIVKKGDSVIWKHEDKWQEETRHYLTAHNNEFRSPVLYYGDKFNHTFDKPGRFTYIDALYKDRDFMRGKIIVE